MAALLHQISATSTPGNLLNFVRQYFEKFSFAFQFEGFFSIFFTGEIVLVTTEASGNLSHCVRFCQIRISTDCRGNFVLILSVLIQFLEFIIFSTPEI